MPRRADKGLWFPLSLAALVLLGLPAVVLLALSLGGLEGTVNAWLQPTFGLSFHNPLPPWAAVFLVFVPPALVLLYFLKLRRQALVVPSTFLWRRSIEDLRVNSLFQWLRDNLLLLVQLAVVLLLTYAALAFQVHGGRVTVGRHYILLIDSSASMSATDVAPSRLEAARADALREIDGRPDGDAGMVIEFNSRASILQPYTRDKGLLRAAVRKVTQTMRPTRIDEALTLADSLANPRKSADNEAVRPVGEDPAEARQYVAAEGIPADVHLYSDGRFPDVPTFAAGNLALHYHRAGAAKAEDAFNVGIVTLNAARDEMDAAKLLVFARVLNFGKERANVTLEVRWGEANLRDAALSLEGRLNDVPGEASHTFELPDIDDAGDVIVHARLMRRGAEPWRDQFAADDEAWLVAGVVRKARVAIVTPGNDILATFFGLDETAKVARVTTLSPADLSDDAKYRRPARAGEFDLVIFDRCTPAADAQPQGNAWYIDAVPPGYEKARRPLDKATLIRNTTSAHSLMRHLTGLDEIAFSGGYRFDLRADGVPPRVPRLLEADRETALLFVLPRRSHSDLVQTFPLVNDAGQWATNWNLKLSFPVFLRNVLYGLGHVSDLSAEEPTPAGAVKVLRPEGAAESVEVRGPVGAGRAVKRGTGREFPYQDTERLGVYQATWPGGSQAFAVNLLDADESHTPPRDEVKLGDRRVEAGAGRPQAYDTWKWAALAALVLLLLEWAVYHRKAG